MNEEQRAWQKQFFSNFGATEILRLAAALMSPTIIGVALTIWLRSAVFVAFGQVVFWTISFLSPFWLRWRPAYRAFRTIVGNPNLPAEPFPSTVAHEPWHRPWYGYLPAALNLVLCLVLLYVIIRYLGR